MSKIIEYYSEYNEDTRLQRHPVEFYTTTFILDQFIETKHTIIDVASGTGIYAINYAKKGCKIIAGDIVPKHIEILNRKIADNSGLDIKCVISDARDLSAYRNESFDIVLCMGPIYHINYLDSKTCLNECLRILKKNGILALGYINKYHNYEKDKYFQQLYFYSEEEIENLVTKIGFQKLIHVPVDGIIFNEFSEYLENSPTVNEIHNFLQKRKKLFYNQEWKNSSIHALYLGKK